LYKLGYLNDIKNLKENHFLSQNLNEFFSLGNKSCDLVRKKVQNLFDQKNEILKKNSDHVEKILFSSKKAEMLLPIEVSDYVDFYSNIQHATNVGKLFRDPQNPLLPNWKHIPIGYHGRSSSIVVSGTNFNRPFGQLRSNDSLPPVFAPSKQIDFELEMAFITNKSTRMGERISPDHASEHIFGLSLFNDWSARDIQKWEYVPLGPFLGKSFASSMSPWIVSLEALEPFSLEAPQKDQEELDYLKCSQKAHYDITLDVYLKSEKMNEPIKISSSNYKNMYWNLFQQLAHMSSNGTPVRVGDVYASGTISGDTEDSYGSMLELCYAGKKPIVLPDGSTRAFLQDGDTITIKGYAQKDQIRVGFGEVTGTVLASQ
jgi:fumarylacetoacetase